MGDVRISAKSTLLTLNRSIEVISGNLTGASIFGFKGVRLSFADTLVNLIRSGTGSTGGSGGLNPIQVGTGGIGISATTTDFSQGSIIQTKSQGDIAIQGNAFFATVDAAGRITYTRAGEFHFDDQGNLVTNDGLFVLGIFDDQRGVIQDARLVDFDTSIPDDSTDPIGVARGNGRFGITMDWGNLGNLTAAGINGTFVAAKTFGAASTVVASLRTGVLSFALGKNDADTTSTSALVTLFSFLDLSRVDGLQDRVIPQTFITAGALGNLASYSIQASAASITVPFTGELTLGTITGSNGTVPVTLRLTSTNNFFSNTSLDNAKLIAQAINDLCTQTGVGASIVVNSNKLDQAGIVLTHIQRALSTAVTRLETKVEIPAGAAGTTNLFASLASTKTGVLENATDQRGNLFHRINIKSLIGKSPGFTPQAGDRFQFDATGTLINASRGLDATSAPPFNTGIHAALIKFSNSDGLQKTRGSSQFQYTEASGDIVVGYGGQDKGKKIFARTGIEQIGASIIGSENTVIPQALEAANTSITESLPELTIAQKSFTSNTKVVNVGNSIVDDLNGLIR